MVLPSETGGGRRRRRGASDSAALTRAEEPATGTQNRQPDRTGPVTATASGITIALRVTPRARRDGIGGLVPTPAGGCALKVEVTAAPEDGRANQAVVRLLAEGLGVAKSCISLIAGQTDRNKVVRITGGSADLMARFERWMSPPGANA